MYEETFFIQSKREIKRNKRVSVKHLMSADKKKKKIPQKTKIVTFFLSEIFLSEVLR